MAIKGGNGRWPEAEPTLARFEQVVLNEGFALLQVAVAHVRRAGLMETSHRDPFDRLLTAQAELEGLALVTADAKLAALGAQVIW